MYTQKKLKSKAEFFENKPLHGYVHKKVSENNNLDQKFIRESTTNKFMTSLFEAYACAITEQEIGSKDLIHWREKLNQQPSTTDNNCHLCKKEVEDVTHILNSSSKMSSRYYLPLRHNVIAKYVYKIFQKKSNLDCKIVYNENQFTKKEGQMEFWWNVSITMPTKVKLNKPDLLIWCRDTETCKVVEFRCPADVNVTKMIQEKKTIMDPSYRCYM